MPKTNLKVFKLQKVFHPMAYVGRWAWWQSRIVHQR